MYSNDYEFEDEAFEDDGRQQLEEYELHCQEIQNKARALLSHPGAVLLANIITENLVSLVREHAASEGNATLKTVLTDSIFETVVIQALREHQDILDQPIGREGYIAIRQTIDRACWALESLLSASETRNVDAPNRHVPTGFCQLTKTCHNLSDEQTCRPLALSPPGLGASLPTRF
jgi:hypothetical protein